MNRKWQVKAYCGATGRQAEISDSVARNLVENDLYVASADIKLAGLRLVCEFTAARRNFILESAADRTSRHCTNKKRSSAPIHRVTHRSREISGFRLLSAVYANRSEMSHECAPALSSRDPARARLVAVCLRSRRCLWCALLRAGVIGCPQKLEQIIDQASQSRIFRYQVFHLPRGRRIEPAKLATPAIEGPRIDPGATADIGHCNASTGFSKQLENFAPRESGTPHGMLRFLRRRHIARPVDFTSASAILPCRSARSHCATTSPM
jgi:hypothetical protein